MLWVLALFLDIWPGLMKGIENFQKPFVKYELFVIKASGTLKVQLILSGLVLAAMDSP